MILTHCRGILPHLMLRVESHGFSRVVAGSLGFLSSGDGDFREPQGCQASFLVVRGTLGFLSTHCRRIRPHLKLKRETHVFSPFVTGISGFLLSFNRCLRPRLMFRHGNLLSAQVAKGVSGLLLVESGNLAFNRGTIGESDLPLCCEQKLRVPTSHFRGIRPYLELRGNLVSFAPVAGISGFLSCCNR